ncbi:nucleic acid-binding, OB-fold protein, partial [Tanacetum coccineum]
MQRLNHNFSWEKLEVGVTGTIVLMFCRMWDVYAATGRYLRTDFVVCDSKMQLGRLYLSSTSSTLIFDDEEIPEVKQLKVDSSGAEFSKEIPPVGCLEAKSRTLENLLMWSRNRKHDSATFHCTVRIDNVRTKNGWNFPSCEGEKCKQSITRSNGRFLCESYNKNVDYPVL